MSLETPEAIAGDLLARLPGSPDIYAQKLDLVRDAVLLVRFSRAQYLAASFLDDRILGPNLAGAYVPAGTVVDAASRLESSRPVHFIFHTGHVGSTLVSRLLDETGTMLSLREPLPLRSLAEAHDVLTQPDSLISASRFDLLLAAFMKLWSRGYADTRSAVVKATSSSGRLAVPLLERNETTRALYMNLRAEPYLATLLAGQNSPTDLRGHGPERVRRLHARIGVAFAPLHALSIGELAALSWLTESLTQRAAVNRFEGRIIPLDFDDFLADITGSMARILGHFGLPADARYLGVVGRSPVLTRYSKAPEFAYTPQLRAEVLRDSRRDNREEIRRGMEWLGRMAQSEAVVSELLA